MVCLFISMCLSVRGLYFNFCWTTVCKTAKNENLYKYMICVFVWIWRPYIHHINQYRWSFSLVILLVIFSTSLVIVYDGWMLKTLNTQCLPQCFNYLSSYTHSILLSPLPSSFPLYQLLICCLIDVAISSMRSSQCDHEWRSMFPITITISITISSYITTIT